jgi:preprotein translocase subunit YajC
MKEIIDTIVFILFIIILAFFIAGFNRQQVKKHQDKLDEIERRKKENDKTVID